MDLKDITIVAIAEGVLLAVCIGLLLRAWWLIRWKNSVIDRYIRLDIERIDLEIKMDALKKEKGDAS
jgi:hypothetical protein